MVQLTRDEIKKTTTATDFQSKLVNVSYIECGKEEGSPVLGIRLLHQDEIGLES